MTVEHQRVRLGKLIAVQHVGRNEQNIALAQQQGLIVYAGVARAAIHVQQHEPAVTVQQGIFVRGLVQPDMEALLARLNRRENARAVVGQRGHLLRKRIPLPVYILIPVQRLRHIVDQIHSSSLRR